MRIIINLYIIFNDFLYKDDLLKLITKLHLFHIISIDYTTLINSLNNISNDDILLYFINTKEQLNEFSIFLDISSNFHNIFVYAPNYTFYTSKKHHIHYIPLCNSSIDILRIIELNIHPFKKSTLINTTIDQYLEIVLENIGAARHLSGYKYLKYILNYAIKHYYLEKDLYLLAFHSCISHFEISKSKLEKALRDLITYAYMNNYYSSYLFLLHYNMVYHKSTNSKFLESAIDYTINHFNDSF